MPEIDAKIIADHVNSVGERITTFQLRYPRIIHAEFMTHRQFSRNASSNRAIPTRKILKEVYEDPFVPREWGRNQPGMQAGEPVGKAHAAAASSEWYSAAVQAVKMSERLHKLGVHKQLANRLLEPFQMISVIVTATEYANFFALRCHRDAQPEIQELAWTMAHLYYSQDPVPLPDGGWHLPYALGETVTEAQVKASVARCARVSYNNHDGSAPNLVRDADLHDRLLGAGHMSPFEHQAFASPGERSGNLFGWVQYRKTLAADVRTFQYLSN